MKKQHKVPSSIMVLGRKYRVKQGINLVYNGEPCLGLCDNNSKTIYLEKNQDPETKKETILHEAVHALMFITGIDQKLSAGENEIYAQLFTAFYQDMKKALE
jgi:Zn-dependent peptidase ImmA (M78 family)